MDEELKPIKYEQFHTVHSMPRCCPQAIGFSDDLPYFFNETIYNCREGLHFSSIISWDQLQRKTICTSIPLVQISRKMVIVEQQNVRYGWTTLLNTFLSGYLCSLIGVRVVYQTFTLNLSNITLPIATDKEWKGNKLNSLGLLMSMNSDCTRDRAILDVFERVSQT